MFASLEMSDAFCLVPVPQTLTSSFPQTGPGFSAVSAHRGVCWGAAVGLYEFGQAEKTTRDFQLAQAQQHINHCLFLKKWTLWIWPTTEKVKVLAARIARMNGRIDDANALLRDCRIQSAHTSGPVQLEMFLMRAQRGEIGTVAPLLWSCIKANTSRFGPDPRNDGPGVPEL